LRTELGMDINGTFPQRSCFRVRRGKSYALEGEIAKLHNGRTLIFHAERSAANIEIAGPQLVELGAVKVTGIGTIESLRHLIGTDEEPYWEIVVVHEHRGITEDAVRVCYIIPADELDVPANTRFRRCSRICLVGEIIEIGGGGNDLTVQRLPTCAHGSGHGLSGHGAPGFASQGLHKLALAAAATSVKSHRVYVGNLNYAIGWKELKDFMREAGEISYAEVIMGSDGRSKGCGIVEFSTAEAAEKAISEYKDRQLLGRPVFVREDREAHPKFGHQPRRIVPTAGCGQVFVTGLPSSVNWQTLKDTFKAAGTVVRADVNEADCTAVVILSSEAEAAAAVAKFNGTELEGSRIVVREDRFTPNHLGGTKTADSRPTPIDPANQEPSTQVFINNLPYSVDSAGLLALSPAAIKAELMLSAGRSKGMGVLEFPSLEASAEAVSSLKGHMIDGRPILVKYNERPHQFSEYAVSQTSS
ncbi:hypothetical protein PSTT_16172, partial [Puccinia striiformis]